MTPRKIIIDTDPGQDDAFAILFALGSPVELEVVGITTVGGNVPLRLTALNALKVVELAGRPDIPVFTGCPGPKVRPLMTAEYVHGETGLDGADLPEPDAAASRAWRQLDGPHDHGRAGGRDHGLHAGADDQSRHGDDDGAADHPADPGGRADGRRLLRGWQCDAGGEISTFASIRIKAHKVFASGVPVTMAGIDCTYTAQMTLEWLGRLRATGKRAAIEAANLADFFRIYGSHKFPTEARPIHDACVTGYLLAPEIFEQKQCYVTVDIASPVTIGMTVVDWWHVTGQDKNCNVLRRIDPDPFFELMLERISALPDLAPG